MTGDDVTIIAEVTGDVIREFNQKLEARIGQLEGNACAVDFEQSLKGMEV